MGRWRILHNDKIHDFDLYSWQNTTRVINKGKLDGQDMWHVRGGKGTVRDTNRDLNGKPEGKRPLGRSTRRWKEHTDVAKQTGWDGLYWVYLAQDTAKLWALQRPMKCVQRLADNL
jgi:hypothetical protein